MSDVGILFIILSIILFIVGVVLLVVGNRAKVEWGGGLVIFIGPFPIVIGGGKLGWLAILIAVLLALSMIILISTGRWVR